MYPQNHPKLLQISKKRLLEMSEHEHAVLFAGWLRTNGYRFHHSPNETHTKSWKQKRKNTIEGVSPGFPDYTIILKNKAVIYIELKKEQGIRGGFNGSKVSNHQLAWKRAISDCFGTCCYICFGVNDAIWQVLCSEEEAKRVGEKFG